MGGVEIPLQEIDFHPTSFCDTAGRVFWWRGELYRGIRKEHASFYKKLFEDGVVQNLVEKRFLVETELSDFTLIGYPLVLKHRSLPFVSYATEWCPDMLKEAGLLTADLTIELASAQLTLSDADPRNILFEGCRPMLVDFCSIVSNDYMWDRNWRIYNSDFYNDFYSDFIYPLRLMAQGYGNFARWMILDGEHSVVYREFVELMGYQNNRMHTFHLLERLKLIAKQSLPHIIRLAATNVSDKIKSALPKLTFRRGLTGIDIVKQLKQELERIPIPSVSTKVLKNDKDINLSFMPSDQWTEKHKTVHNILLDLIPATVLDIGSERGWYSQLAASIGSKVVFVDRDEKKIVRLYREIAKKDLQILPLIMDIRSPSPGLGFCNKVRAPALQRLQSDLVLALSLIHNLVFNHYHTFEQICEMFATFSKKMLLVEFIPPEDPVVRQMMIDQYHWYTVDNFVNALKKWFRIINIMPSHPSPRMLLLCEK